MEPLGIVGSSAVFSDSRAASRMPACPNSVPVFWDAALADRVLAAALAGLADRIVRHLFGFLQAAPCKSSPEPKSAAKHSSVQ